jgi:hypothetical protein
MDEGCGAGGQSERHCPRGQQSLTAAQIQYPRPALKEAQLEDGGEHRVSPEFAARKLIGKSTGVAIRAACGIEQRVGQVRMGDFHFTWCHGQSSYQRCPGRISWMRL